MILTLAATGNCVYSSLFDVGSGMDQFRCCEDNYSGLSQPAPRSSSSRHKYNDQLAGQSGSLPLPSSPRKLSRLH